MKTNILSAIRLTLVSVFVLIVLYPLLIFAIAQFAPAKGEGEKVIVNSKTVGYKLEGQHFSDDKFFWSRPSAVGYNAAGSAGSNKGPSNPDYLKEVQSRIDTFLAHNPGVKKEQIPSELVTASGSGLDPDLSPAAAMVQVKRIATVRGVSEEKIIALINQYIRNPIMGTSTVNVLELNLALDGL
ncbi:MAG: potassium-transporting ATPase subunit KdpC [Chitinophagaceae bacterium]|nr:potassium-transporting ATPase subunit KdpC [Chitinophagaceae bacterium]